MSTLVTLIQHRFGSLGHSYQRRKRNKRNPNWKKSKTVTVWHDTILDFPCGSAGKDLPTMRETWVWSVGWEDPLEKGKAIHSNIQAWRIPWTVIESQRVWHKWATFTFTHFSINSWASLVAQMVKNLPAVWETWVRSLSWEDPLQEGMTTHSSILAWRILPWTEEPGGL